MLQGWGPGTDGQVALPPQVPGWTPHRAPPLFSPTAVASAQPPPLAPSIWTVGLCTDPDCLEVCVSAPGYQGIAWAAPPAKSEVPASIPCATCVHAPPSHQMLLMQHRFKDKKIKNFKTVSTKHGVLLRAGPVPLLMLLHVWPSWLGSWYPPACPGFSCPQSRWVLRQGRGYRLSAGRWSGEAQWLGESVRKGSGENQLRSANGWTVPWETGV